MVGWPASRFCMAGLDGLAGSAGVVVCADTKPKAPTIAAAAVAVTNVLVKFMRVLQKICPDRQGVARMADGIDSYRNFRNRS